MMTREEIFKIRPEFRELYNKCPIKPAPKPTAAIGAEVSPQLAEAAKANPQSVRISANAADGTTVVDRPWQHPNHVRVRSDLVEEIRDDRPVYRGQNRVEWDYDIFATLRA